MGWVSSLFYRLCWSFGRFVFLVTMKVHVIRRHIGNRSGPYILAVTHLSHLEPIIVAVAMRRKVDYVARMEFYRNFFGACLFRWLGAIKVNRQGVPVSTIRIALKRLRRGRIVGIFPEGGVSRGQVSAVNGGPIKYGACLLACRAGVPIVPVVVLGAHDLLRVRPWLPTRSGKLWLAFGDPIAPPASGDTIRTRRAASRELGEQLKASFRQLYAELCDQYGMVDTTGTTYAEALTASSPASAPESAKPHALSEGPPHETDPVVSHHKALNAG